MAAETEPMTLQQAAERLGVHYMTAYRYVRTGRLRATRSGVQWVVDPDEVERLRAGREEEPRRRPRARAESLAARMAAGDEAGAWGVVEAGLVSGLEPTEIYLELLAPALRTVGDRWAAGELTVADEHRATVVAQRLFGRLGPRFTRPGRKRGSLVVGAPTGEQHGVPCALVADVLRGAGFEVHDLGANAPAGSFVDAARAAARLRAVLIGLTTPACAPAVVDTVDALRRAAIPVPVLVGGGAVLDAGQATALGADAWTGPDARSALASVEREVADRG